MPRSKAQFEEMRRKKMELIRAAALKCFAEKGFYGCSINDIAREARISTGLMYNYFKSKEELLKSVCIEGLEKIFAPISGNSAGLTKETFLSFLDHFFEQLESDPAYWKTYLIVMTQPEMMSDYLEFIMKETTAGVSKVVAYFAAIGMPDPGVETRLLFSVLDGICFNYITDPKHYPLQAIKEKIMQQYGS